MFVSGLVRITITLLHIATSVVAMMCVVYSFFRWNSFMQCLPPTTGTSGSANLSLISNGSTICDGMFSGLLLIFFLNLAMVGFVNCIWQSKGFLLFHLFVVLLENTICLFGASLFWVYKMMWCENLTQTMSTNLGCYQATNLYDEDHLKAELSDNYRRIRIQLLGTWLLASLTFVTALSYGLALASATTKKPPTVQEQNELNVISSENGNHNNSERHHGLPHYNERTPLLVKHSSDTRSA